MTRRITLAIAVFAVLILLAPASPAGAANALDFTLANQTGVTIYKLQMSPSSSDNWEEDMLGNEVMESGTSRQITFSGYNPDVRLWDLRITDGQGTTVEWRGLDLTAIQTITLRIVDGTPVAQITALLNFTLVNQTGGTIYQLQMSPTSSDDWGADILGSEVMENNTSRYITFNGFHADTLWDLKATDPAGTSIQWRGLDLTTFSKLTLRIEEGSPVAYKE